MSNNVMPEEIKVTNQGTNYIDQKVLVGDYYTGSIGRTSTVPEIAYRTIKTGSLPIFVEHIDTSVDYSAVSNGEFTVAIRLYIDNSNGNTFTATGGTETKPCKPLNVEYVNKQSEVSLFVDPTVTNLTGSSDFVVVYSQFFRDSAGNRDTLSGVDGSIFKNGRKLVIPPNSEVLVEVESSGTAGNTATLLTYLSFIEAGVY